MTEFENFFEHARETTALRNDYAHGCWDWHYKERAGGDMILKFAPLHWDREPDRPDDSMTVELDEFAKQVDSAEAVISDFFDLVDKYRHFAKPPQM